MSSDLHMLDSFLGIQIPMNIVEKMVLQDLKRLNTEKDASESLECFNEYLYHSSLTNHMDVYNDPLCRGASCFPYVTVWI